MNRHARRVGLFRLLYRVEFFPEDALSEQEDYFLEYSDEHYSEKDAKELREKFEAILPHIPEFDEKIDSVSKNWRTERMGKVELAILRLALYEILYDEEVPVGVAINEAVELTKEFGDDQSPGFVNAILGRFA